MKKITFVLLILLLFSCRSMQSYTIEEKQLCPVVPVIKRVVVLPFDVPSNAPFGLYKEGKIEEGSLEKLSTFTEERLKSFGCFEVITWEQVIERLQYEDLGKVLIDAKRGYKDDIIKLAKIFRADAVLMGYVTKYSEREGKEYGSMKPASVSFSLFLYSGIDGSLIWNGSYKETQQALFENLFNIGLYFKRGFKWLSADELAQWGLKEVLKNFPGKK
ncbi:MAG: hypothetical protein N2202_03360 [Proteobacteria bacterium]|nr:hypothetical protein [Pseudomonadota bacterium]